MHTNIYIQHTSTHNMHRLWMCATTSLQLRVKSSNLPFLKLSLTRGALPLSRICNFELLVGQMKKKMNIYKAKMKWHHFGKVTRKRQIRALDFAAGDHITRAPNTNSRVDLDYAALFCALGRRTRVPNWDLTFWSQIGGLVLRPLIAEPRAPKRDQNHWS